MIRTILIDTQKYSERYVFNCHRIITVFDLIKQEEINILDNSFVINHRKNINVLVISCKPWKTINIGNDEPNNQYCYNRAKTSGIDRQNEIKEKFPEYFI